MRQAILTHVILSSLLFLFLAGCAVNDVEIVKRARTSLVGMSQVDLETCLGLADQKETNGRTTILTYHTNSTSNLNLSIPIVNAVGISFNGYCHATFRLENGRVTQVRYSGETDAWGEKDTVCAPIVRSCLQMPAAR